VLRVPTKGLAFFRPFRRSIAVPWIIGLHKELPDALVVQSRRALQGRLRKVTAQLRPIPRARRQQLIRRLGRPSASEQLDDGSPFLRTDRAVRIVPARKGWTHVTQAVGRFDWTLPNHARERAVGEAERPWIAQRPQEGRDVRTSTVAVLARATWNPDQPSPPAIPQIKDVV
jgi:hypothetical protein